jgi:predicted deacetylase
MSDAQMNENNVKVTGLLESGAGGDGFYVRESTARGYVVQNQATKAYAEHDCRAWNLQHYYSSPDYQMAQCGVCHRVTGFRWRSWWMRIRSLFTDQP